jgi:hypothetical protein
MTMSSIISCNIFVAGLEVVLNFQHVYCCESVITSSDVAEQSGEVSRSVSGPIYSRYNRHF